MVVDIFYTQILCDFRVGLNEDNLFLTNLYEFLDLQPSILGPANPQSIPTPIEYGIAFEGISFQYPGQDHLALQDISLLIPPSEPIALIGENVSGSGQGHAHRAPLPKSLPIKKSSMTFYM